MVLISYVELSTRRKIMSKFYDKLVQIADDDGDGYSGSKKEKKFLDQILSTPGSHPFYDEASHYKNLDKKSKDENLDATRFHNIWG